VYKFTVQRCTHEYFNRCGVHKGLSSGIFKFTCSMNSNARPLYCDIAVQMDCITLFRNQMKNMYVPDVKLFHHSRQCLFQNLLPSHQHLVSYSRVAFDMSVMLSEFIRDWNVSTYFSRTSHYKISLKFIQQFLNCYKRTDRCAAASRRIFAHFRCERYRNVQLSLCIDKIPRCIMEWMYSTT
jgi:hypothetical protein